LDINYDGEVNYKSSITITAFTARAYSRPVHVILSTTFKHTNKRSYSQRWKLVDI